MSIRDAVRNVIRDDKSWKKVESDSEQNKSLWVNDKGKCIVLDDYKGYSYLNDVTIYNSKEEANEAHTVYYKMETTY